MTCQYRENFVHEASSVASTRTSKIRRVDASPSGSIRIAQATLIQPGSLKFA